MTAKAFNTRVLGAATRNQPLRRCRARQAAAVLVAALCLPAGVSSDDADARPRCGGKKATIVGGPGDNLLRAPKRGRQVIVAGAGSDTIIAQRNRDRICAGPGDDVVFAGTGRDRVYGGGGRDYLDLGSDRDKARAGGDADTVVGGAGADRIRGGGGEDRIFGGIHDDKASGGGGRDLVSGGQGIDRLRGGGGDDWLRGDTNIDRYRGGAGSDVLSFATATPPGRRDLNGVVVNLRRGTASGDDAGERVKGVESVIGSMFNDRIVGRGRGFANGMMGVDHCRRFDTKLCGIHLPRKPIALVANAGSLDPGLVVIGGSGADEWTISGGGSDLRVSGSGLRLGSGCYLAGLLGCSASHPFGYVLVFGGGGDDRISANGLPDGLLVKFDGGPGNDVLRGGSGGELLYAGEGGKDLLAGAGGDDALVGRGRGRDALFGEGGNDQLVSDNPCGGHLFSGGSGRADVAGFGHVHHRGVKARIGGGARLRGVRRCRRARIRGNNEVLEGSPLADVLVASGGHDLLIGRDGNDRCVGGRHRRC